MGRTPKQNGYQPRLRAVHSGKNSPFAHWGSQNVVLPFEAHCSTCACVCNAAGTGLHRICEKSRANSKGQRIIASTLRKP